MQLLVVFITVFYWINRNGLCTLVDQIKIMFILWGGAIGLYNLQLSSLYNPTVMVNVIVTVMCVAFFMMSRFKGVVMEDVRAVQRSDNKIYGQVYFYICAAIFVVAAIVFAMDAKEYGLAILYPNKIEKQQLGHYGAYIIYMLVFVCQVEYILFRIFKEIKHVILAVASAGILFLTLNRGPIAFIFITVAVYEVFNFINYKESIGKKKRILVYCGFAAMIVAFIGFFGYIGNMRMEYVLENVYHRTLWEHYGVSQLVPTGLLWVYIYLTSPLENVAFALANESIGGFSFMSNLLYPFIKLGANVIGKGEEFKLWLMERGSYTPYLFDKVGLNAMSFIPNAFEDFGVLGFAIYLMIFMGLAYGSIVIFKSRKHFTPMGKFLLYTNITSVMLWSVFDNSLRITTLIINVGLVFFIEYGMVFMKKKENDGV